MIPVLIAPAYNRIDLLWRMLKSIDTEVGRTLIVDNGRNMTSGNRNAIADEFEHLNPTVWTPPFTSIGYGGAINFGITQTAEQPWWLWASNDVAFHPGHLEKVTEIMDDRIVGHIATIVTGGFTWAAINHAAIELVGLVDDWSYFPIYFDDNDYKYRCHLAAIEWIEHWAEGSTHGDAQHTGSMTINSDPRIQKANHSSFEENRDRYMMKWGGMPGEEVFETPWNTGWPVWVTRPDVAGRATRQW